MTDIFCLRSDQFERKTKTSWQELQNETDFCDVTLACKNRQIKAHKVILSACSPVLRKILKLNKNPHPLIYLRRVKYKNLQNLLNFMYQGEVEVAEEDLSSFLEVGEDLNIQGLSERNKDGFISNDNRPPHVHQQDTSKRKKTEVIIEEPEPNYIETFNEQESKNFTTDDTESNVFISTIQSQSKETKQEKDEDNNQSLVSLMGENQVTCEKCDKQFSSRQGLHHHNKTVHEGIRYSCNQCDYKATQKFQLKIHTDSIHEGVCYPCNQCDYKATQKSLLNIHVRSFHQKICVTCDKCGKQFTTNSNLWNHKRTVHEGVRYPCKQCDYRATRLAALQRHVKSQHN